MACVLLFTEMKSQMPSCSPKMLYQVPIMLHVPLAHVIRTRLSTRTLLKRKFLEGASMNHTLPDQTRLLATRPILVLGPVDAMQHQSLEFANAFWTFKHQGRGRVNASERLGHCGCVAGCNRVDSCGVESRCHSAWISRGL